VVFPVNDLAGFAQKWLPDATWCETTATDASHGYMGTEVLGAQHAVVCDSKVNIPFASYTYAHQANAFIVFTEFDSMAKAMNSLWCGDATTLGNQPSTAPPGMKPDEVLLSGGDVGYYCEGAESFTSGGPSITDVSITISWTDATRPFGGQFNIDMSVPAGTTPNFPGSRWTQLRAYWAAHT
jgi:hypothetical protein